MEQDRRIPDLQGIIQEIQEGNIEVFGAIIDGYKKLVGHVVYRMVKNPADREDLVQEIFIKVYQNLSQFRFEAKFSTWIAKISHNVCINYLKRKDTLSLHKNISVEKDWELSISDSSTPLSELENSDLAEQINNEIVQMPVHFRIAITLYHLQEFNYQEIAEIMNVPVNTVKSYLHRGRQFLKEKLKNKLSIQVYP